MFSALFGKAGSNKADQLRQAAINAFNSIKTPELSQLQVQLNQYVNAGKLTPEQAEVALVQSNAFNNIKTDPSLTGAAKQALSRMQEIGTSGGLDPIAQAQLADITSRQEQENKSQNEAILENAKARGMGGSDLTTVNQLVDQQAAADRAASRGTQVGADVYSRALQALQETGSLGMGLESQAYGEGANKAAAQNAIAQFNAQNTNATNLYNTQAENEARARNIANSQNVANLNTQTQNENKVYNAQQAQQRFADEMAKASGMAGQYSDWANEATNEYNKEMAGNTTLTGGLVKAVGSAVPGVGGQILGNMGEGISPSNAKKAPTDTNMAHGGEVEKQNLEDEYKDFVKKYCYGGSVKMADGGMVHIKPSKPNANKADPDCADEYRPNITDYQPSEVPEGYSMGGQIPGYAKGGYPIHIKPSHKGLLHKNLHVPQGQPIPEKKLSHALSSDNEAVRKRAQFAENAKHFHHADGGLIENPHENKATPLLPILPHENTQDWDLKDPHGENIGTFHSYGDAAEYAEKVRQKQPHIQDFLKGGQVPGIPKVSGDSVKNDVVPAKLSPGEVVLPRTIVANPESIPSFVNHVTKDPMKSALERLKNPHRGGI